MGQLVERQLGFALEHDETLVGRGFVRDGPQQGRLAVALASGDEHVPARPGGRAEQGAQTVVEHAELAEVA